MNSMIITRDGASFFIKGTPYTVGTDHPHYDKIIDAARNDDWDSIHPLVNIQTAINDVIQQTNVSDMFIKNGRVVYKHIFLPDDLGDYVINLVQTTRDLTPIIKFMDNLLQNPDHRVFQQLFGFLAYGKNPLTPDGNFLAYKRVNEDFTSVFDRSFKNEVGTTVKLEREKCNNNPEQTCSSGLHFCSKEYLSSFSGEKIIVLEINPRDVVSIPVDYNNTKGRACGYKIVGELSEVEVKEVLKNNDVLKVATVETKYQVKENEVTEDPSSIETQTVEVEQDGEKTPHEVSVALYQLGYRDGRKKLTHASSHDSYILGYKHGRNKKKKIC